LTTNFLINLLEKNNIDIGKIWFFKNYQQFSIEYNNERFYFAILNKNIKAFKKNCGELVEYSDSFIEHEHLHFLISNKGFSHH
ncbi:8280_t:CDS:1, partial [Scutellospora calospora]